VSGAGSGVVGTSANSGAPAVYGIGTKGAGGILGASDTAIGVQGESNTGTGVWGASGSGAGVLASSNSGPAVLAKSGGTGVHAVGGGATVTLGNFSAAIIAEGGPGAGVFATSSAGNTGIPTVVGFGTNGTGGIGGGSDSGDGVFGQSGSGTGVYGISTTGSGVYGQSGGTQGFGVEAINTGGGAAVWARSTSGIAVFGASNSGTAGWFEAPSAQDGYAVFVGGNLNVTGRVIKAGGSFKIDHPLDPANKYLYHSFVESSEMKNVYDGVVTLDSTGRVEVELPAWFETLNRDFRYQLTPIGAPAPDLHIARKVADGRFAIAGGQSGLEVSWQVTGVRKDAWAQANPLEVEKEKPLDEQGFYLHPELYGEPAEKGMAWAKHPDIMRRMQNKNEIVEFKRLTPDFMTPGQPPS